MSGDICGCHTWGWVVPLASIGERLEVYNTLQSRDTATPTDCLVPRVGGAGLDLCLCLCLCLCLAADHLCVHVVNLSVSVLKLPLKEKKNEET